MGGPGKAQLEGARESATVNQVQHGGNATVEQEQEMEDATVELLDSVQALLGAQGDLAQALSRGWMDLASVRYAAGPHALDHFAACALSSDRGTQQQRPTLGLVLDGASQTWHLGPVKQSSTEESCDDDHAEGEGTDEGASDSEGGARALRGKAPRSPYGPPALRSASLHFNAALGSVAELLSCKTRMESAQGLLSS